MKKIPISTYMFQSLEQIFQRLKRFKETNSRSQTYPKNRPLKVTRKAKNLKLILRKVERKSVLWSHCQVNTSNAQRRSSYTGPRWQNWSRLSGTKHAKHDRYHFLQKIKTLLLGFFLTLSTYKCQPKTLFDAQTKNKSCHC